jgi:hypothetical protein
MNLYLDNSNVIELRSLTNSVTDAVDTGATVTVTVKDASGNEIAGQVWPAAMSHVSAGLYRATLEDDISITPDRRYTVLVEATGSGGEIGAWSCQVIAQTRRCD